MLLCGILVNQRNDIFTWRKRSHSDRLQRLDLVTVIPLAAVLDEIPLAAVLDDVLLSVFQQPSWPKQPTILVYIITAICVLQLTALLLAYMPSHHESDLTLLCLRFLGRYLGYCSMR
jgi:hypothetical protein